MNFTQLPKNWKQNYIMSDSTLYVEVDKDSRQSLQSQFEDGWYMEWNTEKIKAAFNNNNGTMADFVRYINDNKAYMKVYRVC